MRINSRWGLGRRLRQGRQIHTKTFERPEPRMAPSSFVTIERVVSCELPETDTPGLGFDSIPLGSLNPTGDPRT